MVRLPSSRADCMLCVTIRQVRPFSSTMEVVSDSIFSAAPGSSAAVCSSSSSSMGGFMVAIISVSACRWPPESSPTGCCILSSRPMFSMATLSRSAALSALERWLSQPPLPEAKARFSSMVMPGAVPRMGS